MSYPVQRFSGIVYRAHHPKWAFTPLSGEGAKRHGGRFNRPGATALYFSLDPTTAWIEAQQGFPFKPQPMTFVAYHVDCKDIIDLTDTEIQQAFGYSAADLACAWEDLATKKKAPPTWLLAEQLQKLGIAGIVTRSFAHGCTEQNRNLILWDWSDIPPHAIQVIDDFGRLPKSLTSWDK